MSQMEPIVLIDRQKKCSVNIIASPDYTFDDIVRSARRLEPNAFGGNWNLVFLDPDTQQAHSIASTEELADCLFQNITTFYWNYRPEAVEVEVKSQTQRNIFTPRAESFSNMSSIQNFSLAQSSPQYAPLGKRFVANLIDVAIIGGIASFFHLGFPMTMLLAWFYFASGESSKKHQATFGKRAMGLRVADEQGNRLSFERTSGRFFCKILTLMTGFIGFGLALFNNRRQSMHDQLANTLVFDTRTIAAPMPTHRRNISIQ